NENGVLVTPFNTGEYVQKLSELMRNDMMRRNIQENGYESVKRFSPRNTVRQWEDLITKLFPSDNEKV
ncbi:MAG: hypothetical protein RR015_06530, partial [Bacteroidales bacterium]